MLHTPKIATCGGLSTGVNISTPNCARFGSVDVPPLISSGSTFPLERALARRFASVRELAQAECIGAAYDRHHEPARRVDGNAKLHVLMLLDGIPCREH